MRNGTFAPDASTAVAVVPSYPSSGVRAFVHPIAPTTATAVMTRANVPDMGRVISRISRIETPASALRPGWPPTARGFARAPHRLIGVAVLVSAGSSTSMDDPAQTGPRPATDLNEVDEFADIPNPRTRHPAQAVAAALLAVFLVAKRRRDLTFFLSSPQPADLGDARALMANQRGPAVLADGVNRVVRLHGTPDRESALQVDTKGSWMFTELFRLLGTQNRIFIHRRETPLPGFRAV